MTVKFIESRRKGTVAVKGRTIGTSNELQNTMMLLEEEPQISASSTPKARSHSPASHKAPSKAVKKSHTPAQVARIRTDEQWLWVDNMQYQEPKPLNPQGECGPNGKSRYTYHTGPAGLATFLKYLRWIASTGAVFALDFETGPCKTTPVDKDTGDLDLARLAYSTDPKRYGSDPHTSVVFLASISIIPGQSHVIDVREMRGARSEEFAHLLGEACTRGRMIAHNAVFESVFVKALTGIYPVVYSDTMIKTRICYAGLVGDMATWADPRKPPPFLASEEACLRRELGIEPDKKWQKFFLEMHPESGLLDDQIAYVAGDTAYLMQLNDKLDVKLASRNLSHIWETIERPFLPIVAKSYYEGVKVDVPLMIQYRDEAQAELDVLLPQWKALKVKIARDSADEKASMDDVNYESVKDLVVYFQKKYPKRTLTNRQGKVSIDDDILQDLVESEQDQVAALVRELRIVTRVLSTYLNPWIETHRNPVTGNIHCTFAQCDTATGRMCLAKGTMVDVVRDLSKQPLGVPIEDVRVGDLVYTYDDNKALRLRPVLWSGKTGHKKVLRLYWQGSGHHHSGHLDLTPEHPVRLTSGEYCPASKLKPGDRVLALHREIGKKSGYSRIYATGYNQPMQEHRFIFRQINGYYPENVHHKDRVRINNHPDNLEGLLKVEHARLHMGLPLPEQSYQARKAGLIKAQKAVKNMPKGENHHAWKGLTKEWMEQILWENQGKPTAFLHKHGIDYETAQKYLKLNGIDWKSIAGCFDAKGVRIDKAYCEDKRQLFENGSYKKAVAQIPMSFYRWKEVQVQHGFEPYNHEILSIEELPETVDVYDLEIEETHNFIASEICVHNSAKNPNLQNLPSKSKWKKIRNCFIAEENRLLIDRDLSQFEIRALADMSKEEPMMDFFRSALKVEERIRALWAQHPEWGIMSEDTRSSCPDETIKALLVEKSTLDFHSLNAAAIFEDAFTKGSDSARSLMRKQGKGLSFGIPYGVSAVKIAADFKISSEAAQALIDKYYSTWAMTAKYLESQKYDAREKNFSISPTKRLRFYPRRLPATFSDKEKKSLIRGFERQGQNFSVQSINGDVLKVASILMQPFLLTHGARIVLWVHDEILVECPSEFVSAVADEMERCMIAAAPLCGLHTCPIETSVEIGTCWQH